MVQPQKTKGKMLQTTKAATMKLQTRSTKWESSRPLGGVDHQQPDT